MVEVSIILSEEEQKDLRNLMIMVDTRNALSKMNSECFAAATSQIMSQSNSLITVMDDEIRRQRKVFYDKAVQAHYNDIMTLFIAAMPKEVTS